VAWLAQVQTSRPAARRRYQSKVGIKNRGLSKPELLLSPARLHTTAGVEYREDKVLTHNPALRRLPAQQLRVKRAAEKKKGKAPPHNLADGLLVVNNTGRENQRAERKKVKRLLRLLALNSSNLGWNKRRPRK
jgi:hypothetical protein